MPYKDPALRNMSTKQRREWQVSRYTYNGDGVITSSVATPKREPFKQLDNATLKRRSTLVDAEGNVIQSWHIESPEDKARLDAITQAIEERVKGISPLLPIPVPEIVGNRLLSIYPIGDHHLGMLAWKHEVGESYDIEIGEGILAAATDHLVGLCRGYGSALVAFLGDFLHYDSMVAETPKNNNPLDADGRYPKMIAAAQRLVERVIVRVAECHDKVHVIFEAGNHDRASAVAMRLMMARVFRDNPRVTVDTSPSYFHYYKFGRNLIGVTHGDTVKNVNQLPGIMAHDRYKDWGETEHRVWLTGHVHTQKWFDFPGCSVETFRILAPNDAWAHEHGYRAKQEMKAIVLHDEFGEQARYSFNPHMVA